MYDKKKLKLAVQLQQGNLKLPTESNKVITKLAYSFHSFEVFYQEL